MKQGIVLAAGLGTRMRPLTENHAKPSFPVMGIPTVWFPIWHLAKSAFVNEVAVNVGHAPNTLRTVLSDEELTKHIGVQIKVSDESDGILGSSGALWKLKSWVQSTHVCVANADTISFPNWDEMMRQHVVSRAKITLHLRKFADETEKYTDVKIESSGKVLALGEKKKSGVMFTGSYIFDKDLIDSLPPGFSELRQTLLEPLIQKGQVYGFSENKSWIDTGSLNTYFESQWKLIDYFPEATELVKIKMREIKKDCWVPRSWNKQEALAKLKLNAPVCITGDMAHYSNIGKELGPKLLLIGDVDLNKLTNHCSNSLLFQDFVYSAK